MKQKFKPKEFLTYTKSSKGITLAFLVVTIIIMLILAGVTIGMATNEDGIFEKAKKATAEYTNATTKEQELLSNLLYSFENDFSGTDAGDVYTSYLVGDEVMLGGESFYVFEPSDSKKSTVTLLAKYSLNASGTAQAPDSFVYSECYEDEDGILGDNYGEDIASPFSYDEYWTLECSQYTEWATKKFDISKLLGRNIQSDAITKAEKYASLKGGINGRLPIYEEIVALKDDYGDMIWGKANEVLGAEKNVNGLIYWTSSASQTSDWYTNYKIYCVDGYYETLYTEQHRLDHDCMGDYVGVRPLITVSKTLVS